MSSQSIIINTIKQRISLLEVVSKRINVVKKGRNYLALCPFHLEKTPSFNINDSEGLFRCFGCGKSGDVFNFVQDYDKLSFPEALKYLAELANVELPAFTPKASREPKVSSAQQSTDKTLLKNAALWYEEQLYKSEYKFALEYCFKRGLSSHTLKAFQVGYAPRSTKLFAPSINHPSSPAANGGLQESQLEKLGLKARRQHGSPNFGLKGKEDNLYDFFRDRVMFPIRNRRGEVLAFGGRAMEEGSPKYLNSKDSYIFHKKDNLYGLYEGLKLRRSAKYILLVEGYLDVITLHQSGFFAVAPLGTAITKEQLLLLGKVGLPILVCLDADTAGQNAALKCAQLLLTLPQLEAGSFKFVRLPEGEDPDSIITKQGVKAFTKCLERASYISEFFWTSTLNTLGLQSKEHLLPEEISTLSSNLSKFLEAMPAGSVKDSYTDFFNSKIKNFDSRLSANSIRDAYTKNSFSSDKKTFTGRESSQTFSHRRHPVMPKTQVKPVEVLSYALACVLLYPELFNAYEEEIYALTTNNEELVSLREKIFIIVQKHSEVKLSGTNLQELLAQEGFRTILNNVEKDMSFIRHLSLSQTEEYLLKTFLLHERYKTIQEFQKITNQATGVSSGDLLYERLKYYNHMNKLQQKVIKSDGSKKKK